MNGFKTLEKKYGITVESEGFYWDDFLGKRVETFKMYSADGCPWEKGLSRKGVKAECEQWAKELMTIKDNVEECKKWRDRLDKWNKQLESIKA